MGLMKKKGSKKIDLDKIYDTRILRMKKMVSGFEPKKLQKLRLTKGKS